MTLKDKINYGQLTLKEFDTLIEANINNTKIFGIRMWWEYKNAVIIGRMSQDGILLYQNQFKGEFTHNLLAKMHYNWSLVLEKKINALRREEQRQLQIDRWRMGGQNFDPIDEPEDTRLTMGERAQISRDNIR